MNSLRKSGLIGGAIASVSLGLTPFMASAQSFAERMRQGAGTAAQGANLGEPADLITIIGRVINIAIGLIGVILFCYFIYAGFLYLTAGGNKDNIAKAQGIMKTSIIGTAIVVAAYAIVTYVMTYIIPAVTSS